MSYNNYSYESFGNYQSGYRRNSNSYSEDQGGTNRKKPRWSNKNKGGPNKNLTVDTPLFQEPSTSINKSPKGPRRNNPFRTPSAEMNSKPYFAMPQFVEPQHSGSSWNWENYMNQCKGWQEKHKLAYYKSRCMALEFENQMLFQQISSLIEENTAFAMERGEMPSMKLPEFIDKQGSSEKVTTVNNSQSSPKKQGKNKKASTPDTGSDLEFEVSEEMMAFLEKSMRHKLNLKKKKQEDVAAKRINEAALKKKEEESKKPKAPVGLKRKEELDLLYGKNSAAIHNLETSVQLNFNRNCDTFKPDLWMAVPLNPETVE